jgi:tripartite-type tricarboxylate transporter receptor subunit TctC
MRRTVGTVDSHPMPRRPPPAARRHLRDAVFATLLVAALVTPAAHAETYPDRPIRILVTAAPGGITDLVARVAGEYIGARTGQPVLVENRSGGNGNIGIEAAARAAPDGYTLVVTATSQISVAPALYRSLAVDPLRDLVPVAPLAEAPQILVVSAKLGVDTLGAFVALARAQPGKINYVSLGPGSTVHLAGDAFARLAHVAIVPVQYRGTAPGIADMLGGIVQMISVGIAPVKPFIESGDLRVLAAATSRRLPYLPEVPTAAEAGVPGYEMTTWFGLFAPRGTPSAIVDRLNGYVRDLLADKAASRRLADMLVDPISMTAPEFAAFVAADAAKWRRVVAESGVVLKE